MLNYMRADLYRIFSRVSRYVLLAVFYLVTIGILNYVILSNHLNSIGIVSNIAFVYTAGALVPGIIELMTVFAEDFKAKTLQIAIGGGLSRTRVVLAKLLEFVLLAVLDLLVLALCIIACAALTGNPFQASQVYQVLIYVFGYLMNMIIPAAFTMIPMFYSQSFGMAAIFYLVIFVDPFSFVMSLFSTDEIVLRLHINELPYSSLVRVVNTQLGLQASFPAVQILGLFVYLIAAYLLTVMTFKKRELEF